MRDYIKALHPLKDGMLTLDYKGVTCEVMLSEEGKAVNRIVPKELVERIEKFVKAFEDFHVSKEFDAFGFRESQFGS